MYGYLSKLSPALDPVFGFGIAHGLPPIIPSCHERFCAGDAERKPRFTGGDQFGDRLSLLLGCAGFHPKRRLITGLSPFGLTYVQDVLTLVGSWVSNGTTKAKPE
jgi:hypothetical protein